MTTTQIDLVFTAPFSYDNFGNVHDANKKFVCHVNPQEHADITPHQKNVAILLATLLNMVNFPEQVKLAELTKEQVAKLVESFRAGVEPINGTIVDFDKMAAQNQERIRQVIGTPVDEISALTGPNFATFWPVNVRSAQGVALSVSTIPCTEADEPLEAVREAQVADFNKGVGK